jgi:copper(I)-binding protein
MFSMTHPLILSILLTPNVMDQSRLSNSISGSPAALRPRELSLACQPDAKDLVIRDGWIQEGPPSQKITAAYMVIENHGDADISLESASSQIAQVIELHKMELTDGMMKMRRVGSIKIPAGGIVELKPGGYHLMVIGLNKELKDGDVVSITLQFNNDLHKSISIPVRPRSAMVKEG